MHVSKYVPVHLFMSEGVSVYMYMSVHLFVSCVCISLCMPVQWGSVCICMFISFMCVCLYICP